MATGTIGPFSVQANDSFGPVPSNYVLSRSLAAGVAETIAVPAGLEHFVLFSSTENFYANFTATATVPGDVTNGTASELNPAMRRVIGGTDISVISPVACIVTAAMWTE